MIKYKSTPTYLIISTVTQQHLNKLNNNHYLAKFKFKLPISANKLTDKSTQARFDEQADKGFALYMHYNNASLLQYIRK